jgi:hypothetical protein
VAAARTDAAWAVGGLAGAAHIDRVVEPADALVWIGDHAVDALAEKLFPQPAKPGRGMLRLAVAPDEWVLGLAENRTGIPVADPVQLWLDCSREGERALEAADAIRKRQDW